MIFTGEDERKMVALWVANRIRDMSAPPVKDYEAIGFTRDGCLIGGVIYTLYRRLADDTYDITLTGSGNVGWLSRGNLRAIFSYPFGQLKCSRVTAAAAKNNGRSRDMLERLGFKLEGTIKGGIARGRDAVLYGMQKENCIWIRGQNV